MIKIYVKSLFDLISLRKLRPAITESISEIEKQIDKFKHRNRTPIENEDLVKLKKLRRKLKNIFVDMEEFRSYKRR